MHITTTVFKTSDAAPLENQTSISSTAGIVLGAIEDAKPAKSFKRSATLLVASKEVSLAGFHAFIHGIAEDNEEYVMHDFEIDKVFRVLDLNESGTLDKEEFKRMIEILSGQPEVDIEAGRKELSSSALSMSQPTDGDDSGSKFMRMPSALQTIVDRLKLDDAYDATIGRMVRLGSIADRSIENCEVNYDDWQILYCGGAAPVVATLKKMHKDLGIEVGIESFDW